MQHMQLWIYIIIAASSNLIFVTGDACDDRLNELTSNEDCSAASGSNTCPSGCRAKVNEILAACENQVFDFSVLGAALRCYDFNVCQTVTIGVYGAYVNLCPVNESVLECGKACVDILNTVESACLEADGHVPPEIFLDTKFEHPACKEVAFSKAIERSKFCGDWAEIQSVGFDDLCSQECTSSCVTVIDNMFDQCETLPSFVAEGLVPGYNTDCQAAFMRNDITREIDDLSNYTCGEMVEFYSKASQYMCLPSDDASICVPMCTDILNALENACLEADEYVPPEYFLDSKFRNPTCKQLAFSKAIERSRGCGDWAEIQSVGFGDLCSDQCTHECVIVIDKMFEQCETLPAFVVEGLVPGYNAVCQAAFNANTITREIDSLGNYSCGEVVELYGRATKVLCPEILPMTQAGERGIPESAFPLGLCEGDCDDDSDCEPGLICSIKNRAAPGGCSGSLEDAARIDYCIRPNYATFSPTPLRQDSDSTCDPLCLDVINAVQNSCLEAEGYVPPEFFLDSKFENPSCQDYAFSKAIERSRSCGDWAEIQSVGFDDLCSEECTDSCVAVMQKMFDQCENLPSFVVEDLVPGYNVKCQQAFACLEDPSSCSSNAPTASPSIAASVQGETDSSSASHIFSCAATILAGLVRVCILLSMFIV